MCGVWVCLVFVFALVCLCVCCVGSNVCFVCVGVACVYVVFCCVCAVLVLVLVWFVLVLVCGRVRVWRWFGLCCFVFVLYCHIFVSVMWSVVLPLCLMGVLVCYSWCALVYGWLFMFVLVSCVCVWCCVRFVS